MAKVVIQRCPDYNPSNLKPAVIRLLEPLGGIGAFVKPGQKVLLKPNLLKRAKPEEAVTTHPALIGVVSELVQEAGAKAMIGDSPGAALPHQRNTLTRLYRACGLEEVAKETNAELVLNTGYEVVPVPDGKAVKRLEMIKAALEADVIINLPKFKTHPLTFLTGAVKNLFGLVPGLFKPAYHAKLQDVNTFSAMLVDVMSLAGSSLTIVDGIWGMEGSGPAAGERREMGLLVAGQNPAAVDAVLGQIMAIDPLSVPTTRECVERGLLDRKLTDIDIRGEKLESVIQKDFSVPPGRSAAFPPWTKPFLPLIKLLLTTRPRINRERCVACGDCVRVCPVNTITIRNGKATINHFHCIRCFCCHETCSSRAIDLIRPLLQRLLV